MTRTCAIAIAAVALIAAPAAAEVKSASEGGFEVVSATTVAASPAQVYLALGDIGRWWSPQHSFSGDAANLSLELRAGGCFCEKLPEKGGEVAFMSVVHAEPGRLLRLRGALGPLLAEAAEGVWTWTIAGDAGVTTVTQSYVAGGYIRGGGVAMAPTVDLVLGEQSARLKAYLERVPDGVPARDSVLPTPP